MCSVFLEEYFNRPSTSSRLANLRHMEQRMDANCVKLQKSQSERLDMLKTVYDKSPSQRSRGFKKYKDLYNVQCTIVDQLF
jgi:hypothetical protein